jgi:lipopolysaccharide transport system ATP-binding protein
MAKDLVIQAERISKYYKLGVINHGTLYRDLQSWWAKLRGYPDPNISLGGGRAARLGRADGDRFRALDNVSFTVSQGEVLGLIGGNGAGKSTLLKVLSRITAPTSGWIGLSGRVASLLEVGTGFHPELTGRENVFLNGAILGMSRHEIRRNFEEIVDFAELGQFIDTPVKRYSSGMYVRLAFSVAAHLESEILLIDEVLAVGDIAFQRKCMGKIGNISSSGRTIIFVSHNMAAIEKLCTKALVLRGGQVDFHGDVKDGVRHYHDYFADDESINLSNAARTGDGRARIADVWFTDAEGNRAHTLTCGQNVQLHVRVEPYVPSCRDLALAVGITSPLGDGILHLSTETSGMHLNEISEPTILICKIPRLPIRAGLYLMNFFLTSNGVVADWLQGAFRFQVEDADFYGTGRLPPEGYSTFLADFSWKVADK